MTDDPGPTKPRRSATRSSPPKHTQFKKGVSGNPKGRPKGTKNLATYIMEASRRKVIATIGGKQRKISSLQATTMQLATKAASGKESAINSLLDWVDEIEARAQASKPAQFPLEEADVEIIRTIYERMKQCETNDGEK